MDIDNTAPSLVRFPLDPVHHRSDSVGLWVEAGPPYVLQFLYFAQEVIMVDFGMLICLLFNLLPDRQHILIRRDALFLQVRQKVVVLYLHICIHLSFQFIVRTGKQRINLKKNS